MTTLFIKLDTVAYTWDGTTFAQVTDLDYPAATCRGAVYLNKIFYVMNTAGKIFGSGVIGATKTISTLTQSGGLATATTSTNHGFSSGNKIVVAGATPAGYNGTFPVTVTGVTTYTYNVPWDLATPATGTMTAASQSSIEDDPSSWSALNFVNASFAPDGGVCLAQSLEYVIAFGKYTTEAFYDAGYPPPASALSPVQNGVMLVGSAHGNSVAQFETTLVWMALQKAQGSSYHKGRFIALMEGFGNYKRISTPDVERVLDADDLAGVYADILTIAGHAFYVLTLTTSNITLVGDLRTGLWYEWNISTAGSPKTITSLTQSGGLATAVSVSHGFSDGDQITVAGATPSGYNLTININRTDADTFTYPVSSALSTPATGTITATGWTTGPFDLAQTLHFNGSQLAQMRGNGKLYTLTLTGTSDAGAPIDERVRTPNIDLGRSEFKTMPWLEVIASQAASSEILLVRVSDDDYQTWTPFRRIDLSLERKRLTRLGQYARRAIELRHTASSRPRIELVDIPGEPPRSV